MIPGDTRLTSHKNTKHDIVSNFKNLPQKLGQAAGEIFRVAAWTRSELARSLRLWFGQVDAEKLAQRSLVAVSIAVESKQMSLGLSQQKAEVVCESPEWAIGGDLTLGDQG